MRRILRKIFILNFLSLSASSRPASKGFYFLAKPQNIDLKWGQSIVLEALADSASPVTYTWFKDGVAVQLDSSKSILGQGNLKILYAKEDDAGEYKVIASSGGRQLEAIANLNVMSKFVFSCLFLGLFIYLFIFSFYCTSIRQNSLICALNLMTKNSYYLTSPGAPRFVSTPPARLYGQESGTVKFNFKLVGNPKPKVVWYHDGVSISASADYVIFGNDYLQLNDLVLADQGMYQAFATNGMGMAEITSELIVNKKGGMLKC